MCFGGMVNRAGFWSAMASNVTNQSRNVLSKKAMVKKEVILSVSTSKCFGYISLLISIFAFQKSFVNLLSYNKK